MKSFKKLLQESQKEYSYRLKTVVPLDDKRLEIMERFLRRYDLLDFGTPITVDAKHDVLEFQDLDNAVVNYLDFTVAVPMSAYILQQELRAALSVPEKFLVVRADNEPVEVEGNRNAILRHLEQIAKKKGLTQKASLLSTDREYLPAEQPTVTDVYGDKYNKKFLNTLAQVAASRKTQTFETSSDNNDVAKIMAASREPKQDVADFNSEYDTPKPVYKPKSPVEEPVPNGYLAPDANLDDDIKKYFQLNKDSKGKTVVTQMTSDPVRKAAKGAKK
jgi:hypothetical protein